MSDVWIVFGIIAGVVALFDHRYRAAKILADTLISFVGGRGPRALLAGLFVFTACPGRSSPIPRRR